MGNSVVKHKNAEHLLKRERNLLGGLVSQFEGLLKGTVGDYNEMKVAFELNKDSTL